MLFETQIRQIKKDVKTPEVNKVYRSIALPAYFNFLSAFSTRRSSCVLVSSYGANVTIASAHAAYSTHFTRYVRQSGNLLSSKLTLYQSFCNLLNSAKSSTVFTPNVLNASSARGDNPSKAEIGRFKISFNDFVSCSLINAWSRFMQECNKRLPSVADKILIALAIL